MKNIFKRGLSMVMVLVLCLSLLSGLTVTADAAGSWLYNWGSRGTIATSLSDNAEAFYADNNTSYELLSSLSGSSNLSTVAASSLYLELKELMKSNHSYINAYKAANDLLQYTDCQNGGGAISSFYSGKSIGPAWDSGSTWNKEHTWPNSKGLDGSDEDDIMMLRPTATSGSENSARGNTAYGESAGYYDPNKVSGGTYNLHGDVARIFLYVYVRWGNVNGNGTYDTWGTKGVMESKEVLLKWMAEDPVDTWELGRNDSVESITGTRNVFVDYPELAFLLFDEEVPTDMITPSGEAASDSFTITATSNDASCGTVSVSGKVINASPATGYYAAGYEVTSGTATVTQSGNAFVVDASTDCTVQINFAPKANTVVTFLQNGTVVSSQTVYNGDSITLPGHNGSAPEGYAFVGWSNGTITDTADYPTACVKAGSSYTVNGDTKLYAVYSYSASGGDATSYQLVTDASQLYVGASVVITSSSKNYALSTEQKSNNRGQAEITKNSDKTISWTSNVAELTLGNGTVDGTYSFYCSANSGYLYCASTSSKSYLKTQSSVNDAASFEIVVASNGACTMTSKKTGTTRVLLKYNTTSGLFACYMPSSTGVESANIYIKTVGGTATYYTTGNTPTCLHTNITKVEEKLPTCTTNGWSDGWTCNDCTYVYGCEPIAATGHETAQWMNEVPASCSSYGIKGHYHCDICDADYLDKSASAHTQSAEDLRLAQDPSNHDADTEVRNAAAATCSDTGYTGDTYCTGCNTKLESGTVIPMQSHEVKAVAAVEATHKAPGNIAHYACTGCGKYYSDAEGKNELTAEEVVIPQIAHSFGDYKYDANGHWKECSCGTMSEEGAHTYGQWVTTKNAGIGIEGSKERTCSACGYKQTEKIPAASSPSTGDSAMIILWVVLMTASACGIVLFVTVSAKKKYQR